MLAAGYDTLPKPTRAAVIRFLDENEAWIAREAAQALVGGLEGALLIARPCGDVARFLAAATCLLGRPRQRGPPQRDSPSHAS